MLKIQTSTYLHTFPCAPTFFDHFRHKPDGRVCFVGVGAAVGVVALVAVEEPLKGFFFSGSHLGDFN
jgi:hypothetical protein